MRKSAQLLLASILLYGVQATAQINLINPELHHPDSSLLLWGYENKIKIINCPKGRNITLKTQQHKTLKLDQSGNYLIRPGDGNTETIFLLSGNKLLLKKTFATREMKSNKAVLGYLKDTVVTKQQVLINNLMRVVNEDIAFPNKFRIVCFTIIFSSKQTPFQNLAIEVEGAIFQQNAVDIIKTLQPNDQITFSRITQSCADGKPRRLDPFTLTIK